MSPDIAFCQKLIGLPWVSGASGPEAFDCWGLVRHVLHELRGMELPAITGVKESGLAGMIQNARREAEEHWLEIPSPQHLCVVAMGKARTIDHVGLWLAEGDGGIFHSNECSGVVFQTMAGLRVRGFQMFKFYQQKP